MTEKRIVFSRAQFVAVMVVILMVASLGFGFQARKAAEARKEAKKAQAAAIQAKLQAQAIEQLPMNSRRASD